MISAFAKGGAVLREPRYAEAARRAADFLIGRMLDPGTGVLLRRYRQGEAAIPGFLDDYTFFTQGLLDLYETSFDLRDLKTAVRLAEKTIELFEDRQTGAFFSTAEGDPNLVIRIKDDYDGAEPSGNSVAALNLLRLAGMTDRADFRRPAERTLSAFEPRAAAAAVGVPQMLVAFEFSLAKPRQIVVAGGKSSPDTLELIKVLHAHFLPNRVALLVDGRESRETLARWIPAIQGMAPLDGKAAAYVCENYACKLPVSDPAQFGQLLE